MSGEETGPTVTDDIAVAIPSAGRPDHPAKYLGLLAPQDGILGPLWFVPPDEVDAYRAGGAKYVIGRGGRDGIAKVRNNILDYAQERGLEEIAMVDDDLRRLFAYSLAAKEKVPMTLGLAVRTMHDRLALSDMRLIGVAPTDNAYFTKRHTSVNLFAKSGLWLIRETHLRLDERLRTKEDYDFCLQNYVEYGGWLRADDILGTWQQRVERGGVGAARAAGADDFAVNYLLEKWPGLVRKHSTRAGEVTLTVPKGKKVFA